MLTFLAATSAPTTHQWNYRPDHLAIMSNWNNTQIGRAGYSDGANRQVAACSRVASIAWSMGGVGVSVGDWGRWDARSRSGCGAVGGCWSV